MQQDYIDLGRKVDTGEYMLAVFKIDSYKDDLLSEASEVCAESSTGSNIKVNTATNFATAHNAVVYKFDEDKKLFWIAYPWSIFDRGGNVQNIMTYIAGNVFGMSSLKECKLLDIQFPSAMLEQYDGPSYTIDDMRDYLNLYDSPILGTIIKPKIGLTPSEYAEVCYDFWLGGGHFVKNDEPQADQVFCPYEKMVDYVRMAMDKVEEITGQTKVHSFNISASDYDTMIKRADYVDSVMKPGSYAFLVDGLTAGWMAVQTVRRKYPNVFLHFHRAGHGAFTRDENPIGFSVPVLTKMARLAGTSGIHTGTAGVGKMAGSPEEDITAAYQALKLKFEVTDKTTRSFFDQSWSTAPENDKDIKDAIEKEKAIWDGGIKSIIKDKIKNKGNKKEKNWRFMNKTCPIISGGLNPVLLKPFTDLIGTIDFITTMGAGVHSHPMGTQAGAKALIQAWEAYKEGIDIEKYAEKHKLEELKVAIEFYNKKGTQAQK